MKLVGVSDPLGYNPLKDKITNGPISLYTIYQDENENFYTKYVDVGSFPFLLQLFETIKDPQERQRELDCYLN